MSTPLLILVKAVNGGLFVALFAVIGEILQPKRFAGIFGASPAVALANLLVIALAKGDTSARDAATGMMAGAIALAVGCAAAIPAVRRWGAVGGSALLWGVWFIVGGATAIPIAGTGAAAAAGLPVGRGARRRPRAEGLPTQPATRTAAPAMAQARIPPRAGCSRSTSGPCGRSGPRTSPCVSPLAPPSPSWPG